ncbi:unnamed protein product [Acanthosepion pharaonis]|uniref:Retropepsins domain-containing protein n=1 Tax=Acanthosepion pharaonis TaxID=158019 RepID=A0A812BLI9_ACAPH|nr:unnamed protein product [Sepia pharaonis]
MREQPMEPSTTTLLSLQRVRPCSKGLLGKGVRGQGAVATLAPSRSVNVALPVVNVCVEGKRCSALIDTGCSRSIVSVDRCVTWSNQQIEIRTIDGVSQACCGVGTVSILTDGGNHAKVDVLVARQRPLGYDLLLSIDAIRALGGMIITPAGNGKVNCPHQNGQRGILTTPPFSLFYFLSLLSLSLSILHFFPISLSRLNSFLLSFPLYHYYIFHPSSSFAHLPSLSHSFSHNYFFFLSPTTCQMTFVSPPHSFLLSLTYLTLPLCIPELLL